MNKTMLLGRLVAEPNVRYSGEGMTIARFTVAVNRRFKNKDGQYEADFISCVAFGKTADFVEKYFAKGSQVAVVGRIQTGSYEKDGQKVYTTDVAVEEVHFAGSAGASQPKADKTVDDGFMNIPDGIDDEIPFN